MVILLKIEYNYKIFCINDIMSIIHLIFNYFSK